MMKTGSFLDMDMTTLSQRLGEAYRWWIGELSAMLPVRFRSRGRRLSGPVAEYGTDGDYVLDGDLVSADDAAAPSSATLLIPSSLCLIRPVALPALRQTDLRKLVALDLDRLMPFAADTAYADVATDVDGATRVAALPKALAQEIYHGAVAHGISPTALGVAREDDGVLEFDFLPMLRADGSVPAAANGRHLWWTLVALLFLANVAVLIFKDVQSVSRVSALVDAQAPSALAARKLALRVAREDALRASLLRQRAADDPLSILAFASRVVPEGAWVQRLAWTGDTLRLAGYKQANVDMLSAVRKSGRFATVRASTSDVSAESTTGQPFDVTAEVGAK